MAKYLLPSFVVLLSVATPVLSKDRVVSSANSDPELAKLAGTPTWEVLSACGRGFFVRAEEKKADARLKGNDLLFATDEEQRMVKQTRKPLAEVREAIYQQDVADAALFLEAAARILAEDRKVTSAEAEDLVKQKLRSAAALDGLKCFSLLKSVSPN